MPLITACLRISILGSLVLLLGLLNSPGLKPVMPSDKKDENFSI
jgi:hypothetical protein